MLTPHQHQNSYSDISPLIYNESEFRAYQKNIADSAYNKNMLVILPTALGKTVIAILVSAYALYNNRRKRVLVIAPTRPLVVQHMKSFFSVLKISQDQLTEVTGKTQPLARTAIWNNKAVRLIFATPEAVRNDLLDNRFKLNDFSLLIFDEAHRAVKDYAYTAIAKRYVDQSEHPVILAMTASPGSDTRRIQDICNNLFIEHLEYRTEEDADVKPYVNLINISWQWVSLTSEYDYIRSILRNMLDDKLRWLIQHGYLRSKRDIRWIFKRDLIDAGAEIRYNLELSQEELRASLYFALMQQSSALTLLYCVELIESQGSYSLKVFLDRTESEHGEKLKLIKLYTIPLLFHFSVNPVYYVINCPSILLKGFCINNKTISNITTNNTWISLIHSLNWNKFNITIFTTKIKYLLGRPDSTET
jgi:Fanconi anemia group M protein